MKSRQLDRYVAPHEVVWESPFNEDFKIAVWRFIDNERGIRIGLLTQTGLITDHGFVVYDEMAIKLIRALQRAYSDDMSEISK